MDGAILKRPKVLITGANGFTGRHACRYFQNNGYDCIAVTRKLNDQLEATENIQCNLQRREEVERLIQQTMPDYVLHLAAQSHVGKSWTDPVHTIETNVFTTLYLIEAIRQAQSTCKIIVVGSTLQYDPNQLSTLPHPYSLSKTLQTLIAQSWEVLYQMNIVLAKPSNLIGPGESTGICSIIAKKIAQFEKSEGEKVLEIMNLHAKRDFLDVRDAVRAYDLIFKSGKKGVTYEIATGITLSIEEVINLFKEHTEVPFSVSSKIQQRDDVFKGNPEGLMELGWKPLIPYEDSFKDILHYFRGVS